MIYISRILYIAFSSLAYPLFGQLAFHSKRHCCKKLSSFPVCLLLNKVMLQTKHQQKLEGVDLTTTKLLFWQCKLPIAIRQYFCPKPQVNLNSRPTHLVKNQTHSLTKVTHIVIQLNIIRRICSFLSAKHLKSWCDV